MSDLPSSQGFVRSSDWVGEPGKEPTAERTSDAVRSGVGGDSKPKRLRLSGRMIVIDIAPEEPEEDEQP